MKLREARFFTKVSQWELQRRTGVFQSRISVIENGYVAPREEEKIKLAKALGLKPEQIEWPQPQTRPTYEVP